MINKPTTENEMKNEAMRILGKWKFDHAISSSIVISHKLMSQAYQKFDVETEKAYQIIINLKMMGQTK